MYRVFVITVAVLAAVLADADEDRKKCMEISYPGTFQCCKKGPSGDQSLQPEKNIQPEEDLKECFQLPGKPDSKRVHFGGLNTLGSLPVNHRANKDIIADGALNIFILVTINMCERDICIASKRGLLRPDGTIDKDSLRVSMMKKFEDIPELKDKIVKHCIDGDLSKFGPDNLCDAMKLRQCLELQTLSRCIEWDNEPPCTGTKDLVEKCAKMSS